MDVETGLSRIAKVVQVLGIIWALLCVAVIVVAIGKTDASDKWFVVVVAAIMGAIGLSIAWGLAWIVKGFAQRKA